MFVLFHVEHDFVFVKLSGLSLKNQMLMKRKFHVEHLKACRDDSNFVPRET